MTKISAGFFVMDDVHHILKPGVTLPAARSYLMDKVFKFEEAHPGVEQKNVTKAFEMIDGAKSLTRLAQDVSNFVLAHPSEGLKVMK